MDTDSKTIHNSSLKSRELRAKIAIEKLLAELSRNGVSESEATSLANKSLEELSQV